MTEKQNHGRWYDQDQNLQNMITSLEDMSEESRQLFALLICQFSENAMDANGGSNFLMGLGWTKFIGLVKSKAKKRWYDQDPMIHKAFNMLYTMPAADKELIANKLACPSKLVRQYEEHCKQNKTEPDPEKVQEIIETFFLKGPEQAEQIYSGFSTSKPLPNA